MKGIFLNISKHLIANLLTFLWEIFCCSFIRECCLKFHYRWSSFRDSLISFTSKMNWIFLLNYSCCLKPDKVKTEYLLEVSVPPHWLHSQVLPRSYQLWKEKLAILMTSWNPLVPISRSAVLPLPIAFHQLLFFYDFYGQNKNNIFMKKSLKKCIFQIANDLFAQVLHWFMFDSIKTAFNYFFWSHLLTSFFLWSHLIRKEMIQI